MKNSVIGSAVALALTAGVSMSANAAVAGDVLEFTAGAKECVLGGTAPDSCSYGVTTTVGSYFSMDADGSGTVADSEKTVISTYDGVILGSTQLASGSHSLGIDGTENPGIDNPWEFFGNTGMHQTTSDTTILSDDGAGTVTIDFTGWSVAWNGIADIPMGGDTANFAADTGIATMTCAVDCAIGDTYVLDYAAHVPLGDASGFGGVAYTVYLEGTIAAASAIPVPAAVWLFGSGLLGLVGVARRKKTA